MALRPKRAFWGNAAGTAAIEFAIVLPVFLMLTLGILAYGMYFGAAHGTAQLAADAARASVAGLSDAERTLIVEQHVATNASEYVLIDPAKVTVDAKPLGTDASQFRVSVRFDASDLPIWGMMAFIPMPDKIITRTATVKRGGV